MDWGTIQPVCVDLESGQNGIFEKINATNAPTFLKI
jgi:hypothetical protein